MYVSMQPCGASVRRFASGMLTNMLCRAEARSGSMGLSELLTAINGQSSVPVSEVELKDTLRSLGSDISVNWTARTVQMVDILA